MTFYAGKIFLELYLPAIGSISRQNGRKTAIYITLALIMQTDLFL